MKVGIDASNLRQGGGVTHLTELLTAAEPREAGITQVIVWGAKATLDRLPSKPWLLPVHEPALEKGFVARRFWQLVTLSARAQRSVDVLFVPGGNFQGSFSPFVTMSRNLLPFDLPERARYNGTLIGLRLRALSLAQAHSFRRAAGVIFLTWTAQKTVTAHTGDLPGMTRVIPHGVAESFFEPPRQQNELAAYSPHNPFRWIYVSIIDLYKHQSEVAAAAGILRSKGIPLSVDFVGPAYEPSLRALRARMQAVDPGSEFLNYRGPVNYAELAATYQAADAAIFASTCENMPNILLESMAAGLPVACSSRSVMPEVLGEGGVYFDPEAVPSIAEAMNTLMGNPDLRAQCAAAAYHSATRYSWSNCATQTFDFIREVATRHAFSAQKV